MPIAWPNGQQISIQVDDVLHKKEWTGRTTRRNARFDGVVMRKITGGSAAPKAPVRGRSCQASSDSEQQGKDVLASIKTLLKAEWSGKEDGVADGLLPLDST